MAIKLKKKNIIKGARTSGQTSNETQVHSAKGFKSPDSRDPYKRGEDDKFITRDRRFRRKFKKTTSSGDDRVPVKKNMVKVKTKAQPIKKWKKGSKERKEAKTLSSKRY